MNFGSPSCEYYNYKVNDYDPAAAMHLLPYANW